MVLLPWMNASILAAVNLLHSRHSLDHGVASAPSKLQDQVIRLNQRLQIGRVPPAELALAAVGIWFRALSA
jgi:hypothetical protein